MKTHYHFVIWLLIIAVVAGILIMLHQSTLVTEGLDVMDSPISYASIQTTLNSLLQKNTMTLQEKTIVDQYLIQTMDPAKNGILFTDLSKIFDVLVAQRQLSSDAANAILQPLKPQPPKPLDQTLEYQVSAGLITPDEKSAALASRSAFNASVRANLAAQQREFDDLKARQLAGYNKTFADFPPIPEPAETTTTTTPTQASPTTQDAQAQNAAKDIGNAIKNFFR